MPKKSKAKVEEPAPLLIGHRIRPRYREFTCDWFELDEGEEPFKATVRANLPWEEINALPSINGSIYADLWALMVPHITAWNLVAFNHATGQEEAVPPPAEGGVAVFQVTDPLYTQWLYMTLKTAHQGGINGVIEAKNASGPSESGPPPEKSRDSATT